ncbi:MFS transporter [Streptosporangium minutum]|uniref:Major facilitator superfamily (MFS) profile domain-containing protein n=1 Tax=Streptosporangium minutum TaxID=569862 RepID=A0A243RLK7_9ACTN|nr:MFS transporter [Streptosporangium minutum]OUC95124.1 hypothetical protein CA984_19825 [Streptosporangium minutum]
MKRTVLTLACLCLSVFVVGTAEFLVAGLLPQISADLRVSVPVAGQAVTAYALGAVVAGPCCRSCSVLSGTSRNSTRPRTEPDLPWRRRWARGNGAPARTRWLPLLRCRRASVRL